MEATKLQATEAGVLVLLVTLIACFALVKRAEYVLISDEKTKAERLCGWAGSLIPLGVAIATFVYRLLQLKR